MRNPISILRQRRGVAILVALFAIMLMIFVATEVSYDTTVEYVVARQQVNRLKAYYAARAGVEISLLRILIYKKAVASLSDAMGADKIQSQLPMLDPIWSMPFTWPVPIDAVSGGDKTALEDILKESIFDGQYLSTISSEGGKIDINDLGSVSKGLREATKQQLLKIFTTQVESDDSFRKMYRDFKFEELVNNMMDWVDEDSTSLNGGDERDKYATRSDFIPPNAPFKTIKELNMVAEMNEDFYNLLKDRVTIFGTKGVNVNYAPKEVLAALDESMKEDVVNAVLKRRSDPNEGGPFPNEKEFLGFIARLGANVNAIQKSGIPLIFGPEYNFRITSDGMFGNVRRTITAVTFDISNLKARYLDMLDKEVQNNAGGGKKSGSDGQDKGKGQDTGETVKIVPPKGRPTVVYWEEI